MITVKIVYYPRDEKDRFNNSKLKYESAIFKEFTAPTANECMKMYNDFRQTHDIWKYSVTEIWDVYDC